MKTREVFCIVDTTNSWSGEIQVYGVFPTREAAFASLGVSEEIFNVFYGNTWEELNSEYKKDIEKLFADKCDSWTDLYSMYDASMLLSEEQQRMMYKVQGKDIVSSIFYED